MKVRGWGPMNRLGHTELYSIEDGVGSQINGDRRELRKLVRQIERKLAK